MNNKDPKAKIGDIIRISKYKKFFAKGCTANWFEEVQKYCAVGIGY